MAVLMMMQLPLPASAAPGAPVITAPANGSARNDRPLEVEGTAPAGAVSVRVFGGAVALGDTGVIGGAWRISVSLDDGTHTISARARDAAGSYGAASDPVSVLIDTVAPPAPSVLSPPNGAMVTVRNTLIEGTAEPGSSVTITVSGAAAAQASAGADGRWNAAVTFAEGSHTLRASARDAAGNTGLPSAPVSIRVDTTPPAPPAVITPAHGSFHPQPTLTLTGTAEPLADVFVYEGLQLASARANETGSWSVPITFAEGTHRITARARDAAGHLSAETLPIEFAIDLAGPGAPEITDPRDGAILAPTLVAIAGVAEPYSTVQVLRGTTILTITNAGPHGEWNTRLSLDHGPVTLRARARDRAGNLGELSAPRTFVVDAQPPTVSITTPQNTLFTPLDTMRIDGRANDEYGIARTTIDFYDLTGRAAGTTTATCQECPYGTDVAWSSSYKPLPGRYIIKVFAFDRVGNKSAEVTRTIVVARV